LKKEEDEDEEIEGGGKVHTEEVRRKRIKRRISRKMWIMRKEE
jgi:hypothetical protein